MSGREIGVTGKFFIAMLRSFLGVRELDHPTPEPAAFDSSSLRAQLDRIEGRLGVLSERLPAPPDPTPGGSAAAQGVLPALEKQISRVGREQFKTNTLLEAQMARLDAAMDALRTAEARHEAELSALRGELAQKQSPDRLGFVRALLPVLDGLDEALRAGRELLDQPEAVSGQRGTLARLFGSKAGAQAQGADLRESLSAWLVGIEFVRQRLLDVLAAEGVQPIEAQGNAFDPELHIAIEVVPAGGRFPPNTVTTELRRGYVARGRVLRHAEVAATRAGSA